MYNISTSKDKPSKERLKRNVEEMMRRGIKIRDINELKESFSKQTEYYFNSIVQKYGIINPNSSVQIAMYIEQMSDRVEYGDKNPYIENCYIDGKWVTDKFVLNKMSLLGYEFADDILAYRTAKNNLDKLKEVISHSDSDGKIHPKVVMTKTNRISYREPALMNIRKELLWYIIAPYSDDEVIYSVDIKNQEPGILINALGDEELIEALQSSEGLYESMFKFVYEPTTTMTVLYDTLIDDRIYTEEELSKNALIPTQAYSPMKAPCMSWYIDGVRVTYVQRICQGASEYSCIEYPDKVKVELEDKTTRLLNVRWDKTKVNCDTTIVGHIDGIEIRISKQERKEFKTSFLAITYGASIKGIEKQCKSIDGNLLYKKITKLKKMSKYRSQCASAASKGVQSMRTVFGTQVFAEKYGNSSELKRSLLSIPIQGTGADILDLLIERFKSEAEKMFEPNERPYIYYTRHDELIICIKKNTLDRLGDEKVEAWLIDTLEHRIDNSVPFRVDVSKVGSYDIKNLIEAED